MSGAAGPVERHHRHAGDAGSGVVDEERLDVAEAAIDEVGSRRRGSHHGDHHRRRRGVTAGRSAGVDRVVAGRQRKRIAAVGRRVGVLVPQPADVLGSHSHAREGIGAGGVVVENAGDGAAAVDAEVDDLGRLDRPVTRDRAEVERVRSLVGDRERCRVGGVDEGRYRGVVIAGEAVRRPPLHGPCRRNSGACPAAGMDRVALAEADGSGDTAGRDRLVREVDDAA